MKVFIAGARKVTSLDAYAQKKMMSIYEKEYDVIVGDCYGVDAAVQSFYAGLQYGNVTVYASNGKARNNIGNWRIQSVPVSEDVRGFDFYRQKDIAMAEAADFGFMIWDGESKGTLGNIIQLAGLGKQVLIHIPTTGDTFLINDKEDAQRLAMRSVSKDTYKRLVENAPQNVAEQMAMI